MEFTAEQVILIGVLASVLVQIFKLIMGAFKVQLHRKWITVVLFVFAVGLGYFFVMPAVPAFPVLTGEPGAIAMAVLTWVGQLIAMASGIMGVAVGVYNLLLEKVFQQLKLDI